MAYKRYEIKEDLAPKPTLQQEEEGIIEVKGIHALTASGNPDDIDRAILAQFAGGGTNSVSSSPNESTDNLDFFGTLD